MNFTRHPSPATASDWIATNRRAIYRDIKRLGLEGAADYQMMLIGDRHAIGEYRWDSISREDMLVALELEWTARIKITLKTRK